ncbi:RNA-directed DNA polymerase (Reverse transcriptase), partial [Trifolium medium]|nr:RNA-directed DNA polymerase (Reverse transcriptase) [Trifolium medium]
MRYLQAVFSHYSSHFKACNIVRSGMGDLQFSSLSVAEGGSLIKPFSVEEVRNT